MRRTRWFHRKVDQSGFSVAELLVVIIIGGILIAASIPALKQHTQTARLKQASDEVAGTLKLARQRAVATGNPVVVVFDMANNNFLLYEDEDEDGTQDSGETQSGPYDVPNSVLLGAVRFSNAEVTFSARGSASETGSVVLMNSRMKVQRIDVSAPTGLVYVSDILSYEEMEERYGGDN
jgi:type II secretion system protein H